MELCELVEKLQSFQHPRNALLKFQRTSESSFYRRSLTCALERVPEAPHKQGEFMLLPRIQEN